MKVLVAEDDVTTLTILVAILKKWGYEPIAASDGQAAWEIMKNKDAPQLVIMDWIMPKMDGLEVCRKIRENHASNPPYVIILTSRGEKEDIVKGLDEGANDYVTKPFDVDELCARIRVGMNMVAIQAELIQARDALAYEATRDSLTGILNRRAILNELENEFLRSQRKNTDLSVGLFDIDYFKDVNDRYGHQVGDEVLCGFTRLIQSQLRNYDRIGRYGGEEFLVIAPDSSGVSEEGLYERLCRGVSENTIDTRSGVISITVSIGVTNCMNHKTVDDILSAADSALYQAKSGGRNRVAYSDR